MNVDEALVLLGKTKNVRLGGDLLTRLRAVGLSDSDLPAFCDALAQLPREEVIDYLEDIRDARGEHWFVSGAVWVPWRIAEVWREQVRHPTPSRATKGYLGVTKRWHDPLVDEIDDLRMTSKNGTKSRKVIRADVVAWLRHWREVALDKPPVSNARCDILNIEGRRKAAPSFSVPDVGQSPSDEELTA